MRSDLHLHSCIPELTGYLPMVLRLAGRYLKHTDLTAGEYVQWLEETPLDALSHGRRRVSMCGRNWASEVRERES